ncbi:MAG: hypothetical protein R6W77_00115 [Trueperaceae bacterium]
MTHHRPRPLRIGAFAWALPSFLLLAAALGQGADPATDPSATPDDAVLLCRVIDRVPQAEAEVEEGGFAFAYQSVAGELDDGRRCTVYRLRNLPGRPPTPVRWNAGETVLVEAARLARCADASTCAWLEIARYFDGTVQVGETRLSFGLNADSFHHTSEGLVAATEPDVGAASASVGSEIVARLALADGSDFDLHVIVKSRFERGRDGLVLIYDVTSQDPGTLDGSSVRFVWDAFASTPSAVERLLDRETTPFLVPERSGPGAAPDGSAEGALAGTPRVQRAGDTIALLVPVDRFHYTPDLVLRVVEAGDPQTALLIIPMPAFVPGAGD